MEALAGISTLVGVSASVSAAGMIKSFAIISRVLTYLYIIAVTGIPFVARLLYDYIIYPLSHVSYLLPLVRYLLSWFWSILVALVLPARMPLSLAWLIVQVIWTLVFRIAVGIKPLVYYFSAALFAGLYSGILLFVASYLIIIVLGIGENSTREAYQGFSAMRPKRSRKPRFRGPFQDSGVSGSKRRSFRTWD